MRSFLVALPRRVFLLAMAAGAALIALASLEYFDFETLPPFVIEKLPLRFETLWLMALRVHVASALPSLPLCLLLMTLTLQRRPAWHRWLGRLTGMLVLCALVPSGVVLAFAAKGGKLVTVGFLLSAAIVAWAGVRGVGAARRRDLVTHRRAMQHLVGQMSVAVTSRALMIALDRASVAPELGYVIALWLPVLGSVAFVEALALSSKIRKSAIVQTIERIRREGFTLARFVRARPVARPVARLGR